MPGQVKDRYQQRVQRLCIGYSSLMQQFATCLQQGRRVRAYGAQSGFYGGAVEATTPKRALGKEETAQAP